LIASTLLKRLEERGQQTTDRMVFIISWKEFWRNIIFYGGGVGVVIGLSKISETLGIILFFIYLLIVVGDGLRILFAVVLGLITLIPSLAWTFKKEMKISSLLYSWMATILQAIQVCIMLVYAFIIRNNVYPEFLA
jgi:hypothetical protein